MPLLKGKRTDKLVPLELEGLPSVALAKEGVETISQESTPRANAAEAPSSINNVFASHHLQMRRSNLDVERR